MPNRDFDSTKYGMTQCGHCHSKGYRHNPQKNPCPICRGFGYLKDESTKNLLKFNTEGLRDHGRPAPISEAALNGRGPFE
jgi:RecJ-like exonuclease